MPEVKRATLNDTQFVEYATCHIDGDKYIFFYAFNSFCIITQRKSLDSTRWLALISKLYHGIVSLNFCKTTWV